MILERLVRPHRERERKMKIVPSPLVKELRGRAAGAVAAVWRGVNYARGYNAAPANPQSATQQLTRASVKKMTQIWQHMNATVQAAWNKHAKGQGFSGVNAFLKANVTDQIANIFLTMTPSDPDEFPLASCSSGTILATSFVLTWVAGDAVATHKVNVQVYKDTHPTDPASVNETDAIPVKNVIEAALVSALTYTVSGLVTATDYVWLIPTTGYMSKSLSGLVTTA
jgi:hypothetical protein